MAKTTPKKKQTTSKKQMTAKQRSQVKKTVLAFCIALVLLVFCFFSLIFNLMPQDVQENVENKVLNAQEKVEEGIFSKNDTDEEQETTEAETPQVSQDPTLPMNERAKECFGDYYGFKTYESETETGVLAIDISSHQGEIDWTIVDEYTIDFVIHRIGYRGYTEGEIQLDEKWHQNAAAINATDMGLGGYFFSQAVTPQEAIEEARFVLETIEGYNITEPIYFDWEIVENPNARTANISASELTECALAFCQTIEEAGYEAGIYFNTAMVQDLLNLSPLMEYEFWLAEYNSYLSFPFHVDMWQYSDQGELSGIPEKVDLNLYFIPKED